MANMVRSNPELFDSDARREYGMEGKAPSNIDEAVSGNNTQASSSTINNQEANATTIVTSPNVAFDPVRPHELNERSSERMRLKIVDIIGEERASEFPHVRDWTIHDYCNHVIENDIVLPSLDLVNGNRAQNAAECDAAASVPLEPVPFFDQHEADFNDFCAKNPGFVPADGLNDIGGEGLYYEDPKTGKMRKRVGVYN
ncbi:MAG: hypothetical protein Q9179_001688, partial [Wetmoreana sp. 5 TL-2023]